MGALTASLRRLMMMVVGFRIDLAALAAFDDNAMGVMMGDIDHEFRLARPAAIRFIAAARTKRRSGRVLKHLSVSCRFGRNQDHVELGHRVGLVSKGVNLIAQTAQSSQNYQSLILTGCAT